MERIDIPILATYSEALADALSRQGVDVYVVRLHRLGQKSAEYFEALATRRIPEVDLIHVQHEYGLYMGGEGVFYGNLRRRAGVTPLVTTMHAVALRPIQDEIVAENSDEVVVHNTFCKERFLHESTVIPHGVKPMKSAPMEESKEKLGLEGPVVTVFGFIAPYKGIELAIRTIGLEFPGVNLMIAGGWHVDVETAYMARLRQLAGALAPGQVRWTGWIEEEELPVIFGASDVCLHCNNFVTESGALLTQIGYGKCVLARDLAPNREKAELGALKLFKNEAELILGLEELLGNPELRKKYEEGASNYAKKTSWEVVAEKHLSLYQELL